MMKLIQRITNLPPLKHLSTPIQNIKEFVMKTVIITLFCIISIALSACNIRSELPPLDNIEDSLVNPIDWNGKTFDIKAAEDIVALHTLMIAREQPVLTPDDVESVVGFAGSTKRYEGIETQKDLVDYDYGNGIRLTVAYFESATHMSLYIDDERVFRDTGIASPDISSLDLDSTYEDYVRVIGEKGVLIGAVGSYDRTYLWVNSEGHKLEATFYTSSGLVLSSYNYW
jgi:hypothetical protein